MGVGCLTLALTGALTAAASGYETEPGGNPLGLPRCQHALDTSGPLLDLAQPRAAEQTCTDEQPAPSDEPSHGDQSSGGTEPTDSEPAPSSEAPTTSPAPGKNPYTITVFWDQIPGGVHVQIGIDKRASSVEGTTYDEPGNIKHVPVLATSDETINVLVTAVRGTNNPNAKLTCSIVDKYGQIIDLRYWTKTVHAALSCKKPRGLHPNPTRQK